MANYHGDIAGARQWRQCNRFLTEQYPTRQRSNGRAQFGFGTSSGNDQSPMEIGLYCSTHRLNHSARTQRPTRSQAIYSAVG